MSFFPTDLFTQIIMVNVFIWAIVLMLYIGIKLKGRPIRQRSYKYQRIPSLLIKNKLNFYRDLMKTTAGTTFLVFSKVRLADVIEARKGQSIYAFRHISQKHLDFVLCDKTNIKLLLAIELDDKSHDIPKRMAKDRDKDNALKSAGLPILRVRDSAGIAEKIKGTLLQITKK